MSANNVISLPRVDNFTGLAATHAPSASLCLLLSDFVGLAIVFWLAVLSKYMFNPDFHLGFYLAVFPSVLLFLTVFFSQGLYPALLLHPAEEMRRISHSVTAVLLVLISATFLMKSGAEYSRYVFVVTWVLGTPSVLLGRTIIRKLFNQTSWWSVPATIVGSGPAVERLARSLVNRNLGLRVTGVLLDGPVTSWDPSLPPIIGHLSDEPGARGYRPTRYAILAMPQRSHAEIRQIIQDHCKSFHRILIVTDLLGICCLGISPREIGGQVGLEIPQRSCFFVPRVMKRSLDIVFSITLLLLLVPVLLLICVAIKMDSKGPLFFGHLRYGRDGKAFRALKFRTMVSNADRILETYLEQHPEHRLEWQLDHKLKNDPRITRVGRWLRRYSLDELPQLINIIAGHMSLVGPRPIVESEIKRYATTYDLYTRVPPGLTGLWQGSGRNNTTYEERGGFDDYYVRN